MSHANKKGPGRERITSTVVRAMRAQRVDVLVWMRALICLRSDKNIEK
jgi:hypothetical protein